MNADENSMLLPSADCFMEAPVLMQTPRADTDEGRDWLVSAILSEEIDIDFDLASNGRRAGSVGEEAVRTIGDEVDDIFDSPELHSSDEVGRKEKKKADGRQRVSRM